MKEPTAPPLDLPALVVVDEPGVRNRVTVLPVGWIAVRPPHREHHGPWAMRYPALLASTLWAPWMPVNVVLIEHETGIVLVDTGEAVDQPPGHFGCGDASQERFYRTFPRIPVRPGSEAPARLRALGVQPTEVDTVVLSHLHSDHVGGLASFPRARVVIGPEARRATGALPCRLPTERVHADNAEDGPLGPFPRSGALTSDGKIRTDPLPGYTPGHLGVVVSTDLGLVVAGGDAAFDHDQLRRRALSAVVHDPDANRATHAQLTGVLDEGGKVLLAHQPRAELDGWARRLRTDRNSAQTTGTPRPSDRRSSASWSTPLVKARGVRRSARRCVVPARRCLHPPRVRSRARAGPQTWRAAPSQRQVLVTDPCVSRYLIQVPSTALASSARPGCHARSAAVSGRSRSRIPGDWPSPRQGPA